MASFLLEPGMNATSTIFQELTKQTGYSDYIVLLFTLLGLTGYVSNGKLWNKPDPYRHIWFERPQESLGQISKFQETRNVAQKLEECNKDFVIFWGSQSGTAEGFAHRLARECHRRFKLEALVADLSDYDSESIALITETKFAIFIVSTYGEGDPSDNTADLWEWIKTSSTTLSNLRYCAFGLGNSNYKYYNKVVDVLVEKLAASGAISMLPTGKADDATSGTEEDFLEWKNKLFGMFQSSLGLQEHEQVYEPSLKVIEDTSLDIIDLHLGEPVSQVMSRKAASNTSAIVALPVKQVRELTSGVSIERSCLHMEVDLSAYPQLKYKTGDHLSVYPVNPESEVMELIRVLELDDKKDIPLLISSIDTTNKKLKLPSPTTLSALFTSYLEICAPVSRETVQSLVQFAPTDAIKSLLTTLSADKTSYSTFLLSNHVTLSRLLTYTLTYNQTPQQNTTTTKASWSHLPLSFIIETISPLTPRPYSISSSSTTSPKQISITLSKTNTPLPSNPTIKIPGLTTTYLSKFSIQESPAPKIHATIHRSQFKLPLSPTTPLILIGTGTGIAPLYAFITERAFQARTSSSASTTPIILIYGCRNKTQDNLYTTELTSIANNELKNRLEIYTAFSRPSPTNDTNDPTTTNDPNTKKQYVQDLIQTSPTLRTKLSDLLIHHDAAVFICGNTGMAKGVGEAVMRVVGESRADMDGVKSGEEMEMDMDMVKWRDERRRMGRWKEDVWG